MYNGYYKDHGLSVSFAEDATCSPGFYQCRNRECVELRKVCDNHQDCADFSDEENCEPAVTELITVSEGTRNVGGE